MAWSIISTDLELLLVRNVLICLRLCLDQCNVKNVSDFSADRQISHILPTTKRKISENKIQPSRIPLLTGLTLPKDHQWCYIDALR